MTNRYHCVSDFEASYSLSDISIKMIETKVPAFAELSEFASLGSGGEVVFATDDFFATCENMIADSEPIFIEDKYTEYGKWMDGWETRRKRIAGHDWCILKLATKCVVRGLLVDTAFFTGNYAPKYSIQAACLTPEEEESIPKRISEMGTACNKFDLKHIERLKSDKWDELVPITALRPGYEETRLNFQKVLSDDAWTHIRVNIYPDGGIARLRVFGEAKPEPPARNQIIDLVSLLNGAACQGQEWAVFKLGFPGNIKQICVDTNHFKGNYPDSVKIEGAYLGRGDWYPEIDANWHNILKPSKLSAHNEHWFDCESDVITHIKVTMAPDGGFSRIRAFGYISEQII
ncbi:hypothetical protein HF086_011075 [Spodoptera exigua]|uniref:Allantoate amidinohydrolase n=1 Tax=Spodoptera exigua TaxID=7107 RepID=A0A922M7F9_SPOEX|nr:hypothetical protein HF086_011075 [Spodoptera exigua]